MEEKGIRRREMLGTAAAVGLAAIGVQSAGAEEKEAEQASEEPTIKFCVVPHEAIAAIHQRNPKQTAAAQVKVDAKVIAALEAMVKAAKAGNLEGKAALALAAVAW